MPEIKHGFTGGKMNKDLDERLVKNGEYRDAMNVQVSTSEGSDVGTVQNVLGNKEIPIDGFTLSDSCYTIGSIADEKNDKLYYLITDIFERSGSANYIVEYTRGNDTPVPVLVDLNNILKFNIEMTITGINIIDDMMFWTDNKNEPKKINIPRCLQGTNNDWTSHTKLINESQGIDLASNLLLEEKHVTVIKKAPIMPLSMQLQRERDTTKVYTAVVNISVDEVVPNSFADADIIDFSGFVVGDEFEVKINRALNSATEEISVANGDFGDIGSNNGLTGWHRPDANYSSNTEERSNILPGTKIVLKAYDENLTPPGIPVTDFAIKGVVVDKYPEPDPKTTGGTTLKIKITTIDGFPPGLVDELLTRDYVIDLFDESEKLFEFKFPRFSYRYKFEDGEYSPFAPFTQVAFSPGSFDYHPRKGYNIGMVNTTKEVLLSNAITEKTPSDVVSVDILFKDEVSPIIYVVETIRANDAVSTAGAAQNTWDLLAAGGSYKIEKETINSVVPSNQLLRSWDNVPRKALAQDITGNRIVYGNYVQNYNLIGFEGKKYQPGNFNFTWEEFIPSLQEEASEAKRSIKSLREYQLGVVFTDAYGRETPVISNASGAEKLEKQRADKNNRIKVSLANQANAPENLAYIKFFVKETEGEYYNMAMDRFYDAEDGNIWLSFPSSDRNKIDIDSFLVLKKGTDQDTLVTSPARYKVIAVENEAPDFIKLNKILAVEQRHFSGTNDDIFGTTTTDVPLVGRDTFKAFYKPFLNSPGADLANYREGQLYVEFSNVGGIQASERYRVSAVANNREIKPDGAGASDDNIAEAQYSFKLEKNLGSDVNFICDDVTGANPSNINNGTVLNIYKYEVDNQAKFDGRFFVKIYSDEVFRNNIGKSFKDGLKERVIQSKKLYYMDKHEHADRLTNSLNNSKSKFQITRGHHSKTDGRTLSGGHPNNNNGTYTINYSSSYLTDYGSDNFDPEVDEKDWRFGYFSIPDFLSFAFFFNRYITGLDMSNGDTFNNSQVGLYNKSMAFFKKLTTKSTGDYFYTNNNDQFDNSGYEIEYLDETWYEADEWGSSFGADYGNKGPGGYINYFNSRSDGKLFETRHEEIWKDTYADRDTEVWFIDKGPRMGKSSNSSPGTMYWEGVKYSAGWNKGIKTNTDGSWNMDLGFGGLINETGNVDDKGSSGTNDNFWNIGDWNVAATEASNTDYDTSDDIDWHEALEPGQRFRFREDPAGTVYTISSEIKGNNWLRHSAIGYGQNGLSNNQLNGGTGIYPLNAYGGSFTPIGGPLNLGNLEGDAVYNGGGLSMAERLPFNFTKNYYIQKIQPAITDWNPTRKGELEGAGMIIQLEITDKDGNASGSAPTTAGIDISEDLVIYVKTLLGANSGVLKNSSPNATIHAGMALKKYTRKDGAFNTIRNNIPQVSSSSVPFDRVQELWVVRRIKKLSNAFELTLGGYEHPLSNSNAVLGVNFLGDYAVSSSDNGGFYTPKIGGVYEFVQVGMNSYSPNSEFNINTMGRTIAKNTPSGFTGGLTPIIGQQNTWGAVGAVGYHMDIIETIEPELVLSENPAIFETEPKEIKELDIYYEASAAIPINFTEDNVHEAFPMGSYINNQGTIFTVTGYDNGLIGLDQSPIGNLLDNNTYVINRPDGLGITVKVDEVDAGSFFDAITSTTTYYIELKSNLYTSSFRLPWYNCYSFGNGVESNRIRDNFNLPFITNGVKVSATLEYEYEEEHRKYGLIYSGIYNSTSGVSNLNQFIAGEKITKDINPIYGSIQKLHSRDGNLITLCEDKILKILANKDAVFNADGNTNLTATNKVLGQTTPFSGEYGISTNPESFASENYRAYFTDRIRGTVMRLSMDGLTPISDAGMKDWFRDNLKLVNGRISGSYDDRNNEYNVKLEILEVEEFTLVNKSKVLTYREEVKGWVSFKSFIDMQHGVSMGNDYYTFQRGNLYKHYDETENRNTFYDEFTSSSVDVLLNDDPSSVKIFSTLNYEGSQAKVDKFKHDTISLPYQNDAFYSDQEYYNLSNKKGWYVESVFTNDEYGYINEFLDKESKWFNYIKKETNLDLAKADTGDFSFQGIGLVNKAQLISDPTPSDDIDASVDDTIDTGDDVVDVVDEFIDDIVDDIKVDSKTDVKVEVKDEVKDEVKTDLDSVENGDPVNDRDGVSQVKAKDVEQSTGTTSDAGIKGCTSPRALNYNPNATIDDGSCRFVSVNPRGGY